MEKEGEGEDGDKEHKIVDMEVGKILVEAGGSLGDCVWLGEGGTIDEFPLGMTVGEGSAHGVGEVGDEAAKGWG